MGSWLPTVQEEVMRSIASGDTYHKFNRIIRRTMLLKFEFKKIVWRELVDTRYFIFAAILPFLYVTHITILYYIIIETDVNAVKCYNAFVTNI